MKNKNIARNYLRLINYIIDNIVILILFVFFSYITYLFLLNSNINSNFEFNHWHYLLFYNFYYIILEKTTTKTVGKFLTKTKIVSKNFDNLTLEQIIIRSFSRILVFEVFFYFTKNPIGLHDKLSNTIVIKEYKISKS